MRGTWFLAGLHSFGDACHGPARPAVFTALPAYEPWVSSLDWQVYFTEEPQPEPESQPQSCLANTSTWPRGLRDTSLSRPLLSEAPLAVLAGVEQWAGPMESHSGSGHCMTCSGCSNSLTSFSHLSRGAKWHLLTLPGRGARCEDEASPLPHLPLPDRPTSRLLTLGYCKHVTASAPPTHPQAMPGTGEAPQPVGSGKGPAQVSSPTPHPAGQTSPWTLPPGLCSLTQRPNFPWIFIPSDTITLTTYFEKNFFRWGVQFSFFKLK